MNRRWDQADATRADRAVAGQELFLKFRSPSTGAEDAERLLTELMITHADPAIRQTVARRIDRSTDDFEEVSAEALTALITRIRALRSSGQDFQIGDFELYARGVAAHCVRRHFAARHPEWSRLRKRIRYVLQTDAKFRTTPSATGGLTCSLASVTSGRDKSLDLDACCRALASRILPRTLPAQLTLILETAGGALELIDLTTIAARVLGIADGASSADEAAVDEWMATPEPDPGSLAEMNQYLRRMWSEIRELPERQRACLLLNQRSPHGSAMWLLADLGIAKFAELAGAVALTAEELAALWNRLPIEDREIAEHLGLDRQQVINMRASARQRLTRRMDPISASIRPPEGVA